MLKTVFLCCQKQLMMSFLFTTCAVILLANGGQISIETEIPGSTAAQGNYFDIVGLNDIIISGIIFVSQGCPNSNPYNASFYVRNVLDGYMGYENDPNAWELLAEVAVDSRTCFTTFAPDIFIPANNTLGIFYYIIPQNITGPIVTSGGTLSTNEGDTVPVTPPNNDLIIRAGTNINVGDGPFNRTNNTNGFQPAILVFFEVGTLNPTTFPTNSPSETSLSPSISPTINTIIPSETPTTMPTNIPTNTPTNIPTVSPSILPTIIPTNIPSISPSNIPSTIPSSIPTNIPTLTPTLTPTLSADEPSTTPTIDLPEQNQQVYHNISYIINILWTFTSYILYIETL